MEAELYALNLGCREVEWFRHVLSEIMNYQLDTVKIYCDNLPCMSVVTSAMTTSRTQHIEPKYYYIRRLNDRGKVRVIRTPSEENLADQFTKALGNPMFGQLRAELGVTQLT